jgi:Flp pilus assembly CpaE family ATPase
MHMRGDSDKTIKMLRVLLICDDDQIRREIAASLSRIPELKLARELKGHPSTDELLRIMRVRGVNLLLLEVSDFERTRVLAAAADDLVPGLPIVTFGGRDAVELLPRLMHMGVRDHLSVPVEGPALTEAVESARRRLLTHPLAGIKLSDLYTFLPAWPGVGATTIALSASCALAEEMGARTLLLDCDLAAGAIQFLLKLGNSASILDAVSHAGNLDEDLWSQMMGHWGTLEVLHAGRLDPPPQIDLEGLRRVLAAARAQYEVICADLASSMDEFSVALMKESRRIFLVTTPEVVPLHLAAARLRRLKELGLEERVNLLLSRKGRSEFKDDQVEAMVGAPVAYRFSNDYEGVQKSVLDAAPVEQNTDLGQSILNLAHSLAPHLDAKDAERKPAHPRRFLEFFHVSRPGEQTLAMRD